MSYIFNITKNNDKKEVEELESCHNLILFLK